MAPLGFPVKTDELLSIETFNEKEDIFFPIAFLRLLDSTQKYFDFRALHDKRDNDPGRKIRGKIGPMWRELQRLNALGYGIFLTVNETDGNGVKLENISRVRAVWHEDDSGAEGVTFPLEPSLTVQTSPGKFHRYWFCDDMSPEQFGGVMRCMVKVYGGDKNAADLARVLRLPGSLHMKGEPFPVEIIAGDGRRYTGAELVAAFPAPPEEAKPAPGPPARPMAPQDDREADIMDALAAIPADDRGTWVKIGMALKVEFGGRGREIWDGWSQSSAKFDPRTQEKSWRSFRGDGVGGNSIFHEAKACGWRPARPIVAEIETDDPRIRAFLGKHAGEEAAIAVKPKSKFPLIPYDEIQLDTSPRYLVRDVIPAGALAVVWGPPKQGKSFWLFDLCMHVARGWEYRGKPAKQGIVIYGCFEGVSGFKARKVAFEREKDAGGGPAPFFLLPVAIDLIRDVKALIEAIKEALGDDVPVIIVLDTLNRSLVGSESDDKDMAAYIRAADALKCAFSCTVIIVHHCGHDATRFRGHSSLMGALDCEIHVSKDDAGVIRAAVELMKDGEPGAEFLSSLKQVHLGEDADGWPITSCVIAEAQKGDEAGKAPSASKLSPAQKVALAALFAVSQSEGREVEASYIPNGARVVSVDAWRAECYSRGVGGDSPSSKQKAFTRAKEAMIAEGLIAIRDGECWVLPGVTDLDAVALNILNNPKQAGNYGKS